MKQSDAPSFQYTSTPAGSHYFVRSAQPGTTQTRFLKQDAVEELML